VIALLLVALAVYFYITPAGAVDGDSVHTVVVIGVPEPATWGHDVAGLCWSRLCLRAITTQGVFRLDQQTSRHEEIASFGGLFLCIAVAT
jgi:hypothetical protein